jgi:hypothetical protein
LRPSKRTSEEGSNLILNAAEDQSVIGNLGDQDRRRDSNYSGERMTVVGRNCEPLKVGRAGVGLSNRNIFQDFAIKLAYLGRYHYTPPARGEKVGMRGPLRESERL